MEDRRKIMPLHHMSSLHPKYALPVYTEIIDSRINVYEIGEVYEVIIEDPDRAMERGQEPPYNYAHKAILIDKRDIDLDKESDLLLAFDLLTRSRNEAMEKLIGDKQQMVLLVFLRIDKAKGIVTDGLEAVHKDMTKESLEPEQ